MLKRKPYNILKVKLASNPVRWIKTYEEDFARFGQYDRTDRPFGYIKSDLHDCFSLVAMKHLGYEPRTPISAIVEKGFDVALYRTLTKWWAGDPDCTRYADKSQKVLKHRFNWITVFIEGLFLGVLSDRWDDVSRFCEWVETRFPPGCMIFDDELEISQLYKIFASGLGKKPMRGIAKVESEIAKCRTLQPRLLFECWLAIRDRNQEAFATSFIKAVQHFKQNFGKGPNAVAWIAPHHSVLANIAVHFGLILPEMTPEMSAVIVTRESIGLSKSKPAKMASKSARKEIKTESRKKPKTSPRTSRKSAGK